MHTVRFLTYLVENHQALVYFLLFLGLIFEGDVILIVAGILVHLHALNLYFVIIFILLGGFGKTLLGYYIGTLVHDKWHNTKFLKYIEKKIFHVMPHFTHKPFWSIFISKFITGMNQFVILFAGYQKIDFKKYLQAEVSSTLLWAPGLMALGYFFSYTAIHVSREIWRFCLIVLLLIILFVVLDKMLSWAYELFEEFYDDDL